MPHNVVDRDAVLADYKAGMPIKEIAAKYSISLSYPSRIAKERGLPRRVIMHKYDQVGKRIS